MAVFLHRKKIHLGFIPSAPVLHFANVISMYQIKKRGFLNEKVNDVFPRRYHSGWYGRLRE
jgi:hypothetical protein